MVWHKAFHRGRGIKMVWLILFVVLYLVMTSLNHKDLLPSGVSFWRALVCFYFSEDLLWLGCLFWSVYFWRY